MGKRNKEKRTPMQCIEVEQSPIDESLPYSQYMQQMAKDVQQIPLDITQNGKTYKAVDAFLKRREGDLAVWSTIYCDKPDRYDVNNRPADIRAIIDSTRPDLREQDEQSKREALKNLCGRAVRILGVDIEDDTAHLEIKPLGDDPGGTLSFPLNSETQEFLAQIGKRFPRGAFFNKDGSFQLLPF